MAKRTPKKGPDPILVKHIFASKEAQPNVNKVAATILTGSRKVATEAHERRHIPNIQGVFEPHSLSLALVAEGGPNDDRVTEVIRQKIISDRAFMQLRAAEDEEKRRQRHVVCPSPIPVEASEKQWGEFCSNISFREIIQEQHVLNNDTGPIAFNATRKPRIGPEYQAAIPPLMVDLPWSARHSRGDLLACSPEDSQYDKSWTLFDCGRRVADPVRTAKVRHAVGQFNQSEQAAFLKRWGMRPKNFDYIASKLGRTREQCIQFYYGVKHSDYGKKLRAAESDHYKQMFKKRAGMQQTLIMQSLAGMNPNKMPRELASLMGSGTSFDAFMEASKRRASAPRTK
ncbi:Proteophosphoglycan ppg4 [Carpediemonas membranifera]|uniref:Proteophosphoglycan ppg4 n=1 Tax=Carpediemonas membranifera TaxID=201153 RepID=A0A8J6ATL0_9EUKA|nr:Proteophosphoglycan ppg4 [Carpediemonas membranifera]|eukprot:KAG9391155.1 Proteophosphoglycan ppg4 [Carpediemonas membranifera]